MKRKRNISVVCQRKIAKININLVEFVLVFVWQTGTDSVCHNRFRLSEACISGFRQPVLLLVKRVKRVV